MNILKYLHKIVVFACFSDACRWFSATTPASNYFNAKSAKYKKELEEVIFKTYFNRDYKTKRRHLKSGRIINSKTTLKHSKRRLTGKF